MVSLKLLCLLLVAVKYISPGEAVRSPFDACSVGKKSCKIEEDNLISSVPTDNIEQCRQLCSDTENCQYLSFFGSTNFPIGFVHSYILLNGPPLAAFCSPFRCGLV